MFPVQAPELELDSMEERMLTSYLLFLLPPAPSPTARTTGHNGHSLSLSLSLSYTHGCAALHWGVVDLKRAVPLKKLTLLSPSTVNGSLARSEGS